MAANSRGLSEAIPPDAWRAHILDPGGIAAGWGGWLGRCVTALESLPGFTIRFLCLCPVVSSLRSSTTGYSLRTLSGSKDWKPGHSAFTVSEAMPGC
jgi:hypothetical protein